MTANQRGPYSRVIWFCNDGTTQPPTPFACNDHDGGRQHGEYSPNRVRLAELGWSVGTIFAALGWDELWDGEHRQQRLRELALERYLIDIDDGWVMRQARTYRGAVQVEAEERAGRALLLQLLADRDWLADNFLLARESVRVIPHSDSAEDQTRTIRREATELADRESSFGPLRVEIHGTPTAATAARVRAWATEREGDAALAANTLAQQLDTLYGAAGRRARLVTHRDSLARRTATAAVAAALPIDIELAPAERIAGLAATLSDARAVVLAAATTATQRLALLDVIADVESELALSVAELLAGRELSRAELITLARRLVDATHGGGLLTDGEHAALLADWPPLAAQDPLRIEDYAAMVDYLRRVPQWTIGSVRYTFAEPLVRYTALDPRAASFVDDLLRGSPLVGLAEVTRRLALDVAALTGVTQTFDGDSGITAFGLNPGVATGRLVVFATNEEVEHGVYDRGDIVVLPETVAELKPVAGIITLGEGSPLSHVQLLARNFGIPNIAIGPSLLPRLLALQGLQVLAAVASDGSLVLAPLDDVDAGVRALLGTAKRAELVTIARPDLSVREAIPLAQLNTSLSGRLVGPKAANLGELARLFPGRVAPAIAVPFGIFAEHLEAGDNSIRSRLVAAYAEQRAGSIGDDELNMRLAGIRDDIAALRLLPEARAELTAAMAQQFGTPGTYGLFLRSDTNVEDLPEFTGAGLSLTVPNLVTPEQQLDTLSLVWASVLSPRAIAWRSSLLTNPEEVYASVLLMRSVPSAKSGVLVTADLTGHGDGLTVSMAWGVGGAVAGEATETLVLHDGGVRLVSEAKTAYQRKLDPAGGLSWEPAAHGPVLTAADRDAVRRLAAEVNQKYEPVFDENGRARPWDIEFGFVDDELTLFQIRPLVERGPQLADRIVAALAPARTHATPTQVDVLEPPLTGSGATDGQGTATLSTGRDP